MIHFESEKQNFLCPMLGHRTSTYSKKKMDSLKKWSRNDSEVLYHRTGKVFYHGLLEIRKIRYQNSSTPMQP